jgi:hypothetical protein
MISNNIDFPIKYGFKYNYEYNEWQKPFSDGILVICEKYNTPGIWEMSFSDENDQLHPIVIGDEDYIVENILLIIRIGSIDGFINLNNFKS